MYIVAALLGERESEDVEEYREAVIGYCSAGFYQEDRFVEEK